MDDPALRGHLALLRALAWIQIDGEKGLAGYRKALALALKAGDQAGAGLVELDLANLAWHANRSEEMIRHYTAARRYFAAAGFAQSVENQELNLARSLMRRGTSPEALARLLRLLAQHDAATRSTRMRFSTAGDPIACARSPGGSISRKGRAKAGR